jgi:hypothetical protein
MRNNKPNFFLIGAAKSGTTTLHEYLSKHSDIFFPKMKELHFFDVDENYKKGDEWYLSEYFSGASSYYIRGESTPAYLAKYELVATRMRKMFAEVENPKFVVILRDPAARAWSHYLHRVRVAVEDQSFEKALELEKERLAENSEDWCGYYSDGLYCRQLEYWFSIFGKESFHVILTEDLKNNTEETVENIYNFLKIPEQGVKVLATNKNVASRPRNYFLMNLVSKPNSFKNLVKWFIPKKVRPSVILSLRKLLLVPYDKQPTPEASTMQNLKQKYIPEIEALEKLIDRDLSLWKK